MERRSGSNAEGVERRANSGRKRAGRVADRSSRQPEFALVISVVETLGR